MLFRSRSSRIRKRSSARRPLPSAFHAMSFSRLACNCTRSAAASTSRRLPALLPSRRSFTSSVASLTSSSDAPLPWFVDPSTLPAAPTSAAPKRAVALEILPPPPELPDTLHGLHAHLSVSPFLNRDAITFINAREADPENTWVDWVVICTLKRGREGGLRGAIEGVRSFVRRSSPHLPTH